MRRVLVGLGNPGKIYQNTRHNLGASVLKSYARNQKNPTAWKSCNLTTNEITFVSPECCLILPQTYMNLSGKAVTSFLEQHPQFKVQDLLIVLDDMDLPVGMARIKPQGGSGGHNGLADILKALGRKDVPRLKIGIGRPEEASSVRNFVLDEFNEPHVLSYGEAILDLVLSGGLERAMEFTNSRKTPVT